MGVTVAARIAARKSTASGWELIRPRICALPASRHNLSSSRLALANSSKQSAHQSALHNLNQQEIRDTRNSQKQEECSWQRSEAKQAAERRVRNHHPNQHNEHSRRRQSDARPAAQRVPCCTDNEDDERLGGKRLDEPPGMEQLFRRLENPE